MIYKNLDGVIPAPGKERQDSELLEKVDSAVEELEARFDEFAFSLGLEAWMGAVFACNAYVDAPRPGRCARAIPSAWRTCSEPS
jgi:methionyl-tRNA synthetase